MKLAIIYANLTTANHNDKHLQTAKLLLKLNKNQR